MSKAISSRAPQTNQEAVAEFHQAFRGRRVEEGDVLILPDVGQVYTVVGHKFWKKKDSNSFTIGLVFESDCMVCDQPFTQVLHRHFKGLARTCKAHRGKWKNPNRTPRSRRPSPRKTPFHDAIRQTLDAFSLAADSVSLDDVVARAATLVPRGDGARDIRRQSVHRAIRTLHEQGRLDCVLVDGRFIF